MGETPGSGESAETLFSQGLDHHDRENYDEAIRCYKRAVELDPKMVVAHNNLGMVYIDRGLFDEAIAELSKTIVLDEGYAEAYNNLGFVYRRTGDEPKAAAFYEKFLDLEPDVEDAPKIRGWLEKVRANSGSLPDLKELVATSQTGAPAAAEPEKPDITGATEMSGVLAEALDRSEGGADAPAQPTSGAAEPPAQPAPGGAEAGSTGAIGDDDDFFDAKTFTMQPDQMQAMLDATGKGPPPAESPPQPPSPAAPAAPAAPPAAAPADAPQAPQEESPEVLCEKGLSQFEKGDVPGAEQTLRRAVQMDPRLALARSTLGRVLATAGRYDEAAAELQQAVSLQPTDAPAYYVLGYALRELGQNRSAADAYERYLELTPDAAEGAQIRAWVGEVRASAQMTPAELYRQALQHYEEENLDQALEECEEVLAADEANGEANLLLGRILVQKGDLIRAVPALKRAEPLQPNNSEVHFYLGQAYEKRGLPEEARSAYQRCLDVDAAGSYAQYVRTWLERARGAEAGAAVRCEYCFRAFAPEDLSTHEGKKICADCMANLNIAPAEKVGSPALQQSVFDRAAADEAARRERRRAKARVGRYALLASLSVVAVLLLMLMVLMFGWLSGPLEKMGVYRGLQAIGLRGLMSSLGVQFPEAREPGADEIPVDISGKAGGEQKPPEAVPLALSVEKELFHAVPFVEFKTKAEARGAAGEYRFELAEAPDGMKIDEAAGSIAWRPPRGFLLNDEGRLELPRRVPVEVKVTSADQSRAVAFEVAVDFAFELGPVIDAEIRPGDTVKLAVGKLNVSDERVHDDIALASGRYREGWLRVLYEQGLSGQFSLGQPIDLGGVPSALVLADVNSDGRADVVVANWSTSELLVFRQNDEGLLSAEPALRTAKGVDFLASGDFDGDGDADIVVSHWAEPKLLVCPQEVEEGAGRFGEPQLYPTARASGWNRVIVGPIAGVGGSGPKAVYLVAGSGGRPRFFMYAATPDGKLEFYRKVEPTGILPEHPLETMPVRLGEGLPHVVALIGGGEPELYVIRARDDSLEVLSKQKIEGAPQPVGMTVADINGDSVDDVVVLCAEKLRVLLGSSTEGEPFIGAASVDVPLAVGPVAVGEFTRDGLPDVAVVLDDGRLQIVQAAHLGGGAE